MDNQSENFYKNIIAVFPYILLGFIMALVINYLIMQTMKVTSPESLGIPFKAGSVSGDGISINYVGYVGNIILGTIIFSIIVPIGKGIFIKNSNN
jgi:hypothetical protein